VRILLEYTHKKHTKKESCNELLFYRLSKAFNFALFLQIVNRKKQEKIACFIPLLYLNIYDLKTQIAIKIFKNAI
jgi:hypothetical protein